MKIELTVTGERAVLRHSRSENETCTVAKATIDGSPQLIADSLRALADSIYQPIAFAEVSA
jgi:hypothetical protein